MELPSTTPIYSEHSSEDDDSSSISPSDSASNYGGEEDVEVNPEDMNRVPYIVRRTIITNRLLDLQLKSNLLTTMFNKESTYQKEKNNELANAQKSEWIAKCIEVINDTRKIQIDIIDHHLSKHKKREGLDYIASIELIEEWMEKVAATWARTYHQLRLYAFLQDDNDSSDAEKLIIHVRKLLCLLIQESFWVIEPPPKIIVLHKQFNTAVATLLPKALCNIELTGKASVVDMDQFYRDHHTQKIIPGEFYRSPNGILENDELILSVDRSAGYFRFRNLRLDLITRRDAKECVFDSKYHLLYEMLIKFPDLDMLLSCRFISYSLTVVESEQEATAWAFLNPKYEI